MEMGCGEEKLRKQSGLFGGQSCIFPSRFFSNVKAFLWFMQERQKQSVTSSSSSVLLFLHSFNE